MLHKFRPVFLKYYETRRINYYEIRPRPPPVTPSIASSAPPRHRLIRIMTVWSTLNFLVMYQGCADHTAGYRGTSP